MADLAAMEDADYSALVIEHFNRPRNVGMLEPADDVIYGRAGRRDQGVAFAVSARVADNEIAEARFEVYGCPHCVAAGSWLAQSLVGADQDYVRRWSWRELPDALGIPAAKRGRLLILEDAVRALAEDWRKRF
jgi:NifU-like protein involved in Fe-S cluster formation